ncbi:hypothetical protein BH09ACT4_BH09ACT4_07460 [soil metagenome]
MPLHTVISARSPRYSRSSRFRPVYYVPLALFSFSIVGGLAVLAAELPGSIF